MKRMLLPILAIGVLLLSACSAPTETITITPPPETVTITPPPETVTVTAAPKEVEIRLAPIHEVQVLIAESFPEQIFVYIKGGLADSCTTFHELITERSGNTINITVTTERPRDAFCAQVYSYFEQNIALGSDFTRGESYTVNVNDMTSSFDYPD